MRVLFFDDGEAGEGIFLGGCVGSFWKKCEDVLAQSIQPVLVPD